MKFKVRLGGACSNTMVVEFEREGNAWRISLDGKIIDADITEIAPEILSVLVNGHSYEIRIVAPGNESSRNGNFILKTGVHEFTAEIVDPRAWRGRRHAAIEAEGRQQVVASMPGKIIRSLVQAGDRVEAGQGLVVVEAMKMQNEIRAPKSGIVERLLINEGQAVNAGDVLCTIA